MIFSTLILGIALQSKLLDKPTLQYYQGAFAISEKGTTTQVPVEDAQPPLMKPVAFRKNDVFAVWDERGLTVRNKERALSSRLPDIAVSPKVFSRDEILKTVKRIRAGECTKAATALSGAKRIGKDAFFLLRWEDSKSVPWAEVLVRVDLTEESPEPHVVGRFGGLSMARLPIDDKLQLLHGRLAVIEHTASSWGLSTYDPTTNSFQTQQMGGQLKWVTQINTTQALFTETSAYGTNIAGRVDLETGTRKILFEGREFPTFVDEKSPEFLLASNGSQTKVVNAATGAVRMFPANLHGKRVDARLLLWLGQVEPTAAWLEAPSQWTTLATWRAPSTGKAIKP